MKTQIVVTLAMSLSLLACGSAPGMSSKDSPRQFSDRPPISIPSHSLPTIKNGSVSLNGIFVSNHPVLNLSVDAGAETPDAGNADPNQTYVTDLPVTFGGSEDGDTLTVRSHRAAPSFEESIHITPAEYDGEDYYEVGADITWSASDPMVTLQMLDGPMGLTTSPTFDTDCLDTGTCPTEPSATVTACVTNDCPATATNCKLTVCINVPIKGIVNLKGMWAWTGYNLPATAKLLQGGRFVVVPAISNDRGIVLGDKIELRDDTHTYDGTISPDHQHMSGTVTDVLVDIPLGAWSAVRISP